MTAVAWVGLVAAVVAATAALVVGDALTVQGRLRRKLVAELGVVDKLSEGELRDAIGRVAERHAAELYVRSRRQVRVPPILALIWLLVAGGASITFALTHSSKSDSVATQLLVSIPLWVVATITVALTLWTVDRHNTSIDVQKVLKIVEQNKATDLRSSDGLTARRQGDT